MLKTKGGGRAVADLCANWKCNECLDQLEYEASLNPTNCPTCGREVPSIFSHVDQDCENWPDSWIVVDYVGFLYHIHLDLNGRAVMADPLPHQHRAAGKDHHRRAAIEIYNERFA